MFIYRIFRRIRAASIAQGVQQGLYAYSVVMALMVAFRIQAKYENIIIVSHGTAINCFLMRWHHWTVDKFESLPNMGNCELVEVFVNNQTEEG